MSEIPDVIPGDFCHFVERVYGELPGGVQVSGSEDFVAARILTKFAGSVRNVGDIVIFHYRHAAPVVFDDRQFFLVKDAEVLGAINGYEPTVSTRERAERTPIEQVQAECEAHFGAKQ